MPPSSTSLKSVPVEFRAACGHPGARVQVRKVPVTVSHRACDLTGVLVTYRDFVGAHVPSSPGMVGNTSGLTITASSGSRDVTVNATGVPRQRLRPVSIPEAGRG